MATPRGGRPDACPGISAMHEAADGMVARVRLPAGRVGSAQLRVLADCADELGDDVLYLTSRANVQLRGMSERGTELAARLAEAGLLPAAEHERVRNYLASPASGYFGGHSDVRTMLRELDSAVCADTELASLPRRFLFGLDDGRGDVARAGADVCWQALPSGAAAGSGMLLLDGADTGLRVDSARAVDTLVRCARAFLELRTETGDDTWRVRDLPDVRALLTDTVAAAGRFERPRHEPRATATPVPIGVSTQVDGLRAVCAAPVLGELSTKQARLIAAATNEVVLTPWRTVLAPDIEACEAERVATTLSHAGLGVHPAAPWLGISACVGLPACAKSHADVRADARELMRQNPEGVRAHVAGCARRCGKPQQPHTDVLAGPDGYRVDGALVPTGALAETLARGASGGADTEGTM